MSSNLLHSLDFLARLARFRMAPHFGAEAPAPEIPVFAEDEHPFSRFVLENNLTVDELTALAVGLAPHVQPTFFDELMLEFLPKGGDFLPLGGVKGINHRGFLPTGETVFFLLAEKDWTRRAEVWQLFDSEHFFQKRQILFLEEMRPGEPATSGRLILEPEFVELFTLGKVARPRFGMNFPAERLETRMTWDDLVLPHPTRKQVQELETWLRHGQTLLNDWGMNRQLKPGFRALFHGPPGTGKTLTATLLAKVTGRDIYRIDLSMVVSKFIGETEKNLANLFAKAEHKDWILFFDEADALFGKRTSVRDAHDKYANQEVAYLLQRVEAFNGLVILASNFKSNIDEAFMRRFQSVVSFPMPGPAERLLLWQKSFPENVRFNHASLPALAQRYELSGAGILNAVQFACLRCLEHDHPEQPGHIHEEDIREGILREFAKEGKIAY